MDKSITRLILSLARKSQSYIGWAMGKYDLTAAEQPFFMAMQAHEGATQEELTALVGVDKAATARAVKSLEEKGYLTRMQDARDRRQKRIYPTEKAKLLSGDVKHELLRFNAGLTRGIESSCLDTAYETLRKMEENFTGISDGDADGREG